MLSKIYTCTLSGADGELTSIEAYISRGLPAFHIVGLTDTVIKESIERIRAAIGNSEFVFPINRISVNLAPADKKKSGSHYDLAIAVALLKASRQIEDFNENNYAFFGELALDGKINSVPGLLPLAMCAEENKIKNIIVPMGNIEEALFIKESNIIGVNNLKEAVDVLHDKQEVKNIKQGNEIKRKKLIKVTDFENDELDFSQVYGQEVAKRAVIISAAGGHNMLLQGPPGVGKSMIAKRFAGILPKMTYEEQKEVTKIYSIAGMLDEKMPVISKRPFRMPHSSITTAALIGGGSKIKPGEISLADKGVLFLDEVNTFNSQVLQRMRQPMEDREVKIVRNRECMSLPADFILICAANVCGCGYAGDDENVCVCTQAQLASFREKLSAPFMDRIDIYVKMAKVKYEEAMQICDSHASGASKKRLDTRSMLFEVERVREIQRKRYKGEKIDLNGRLDAKMIEKYISLDGEASEFLKQAYEKLKLSMRGMHKMLKVARTIADLDNSKEIKIVHLAEALSYRRDREG